MSEIFVVDIFN